MIGTVLIVDDESLVRKTLRKMIESNETGWRVVAEASNGHEALEAMAAAEPDLVITDVRMPLMSGIELAEQIHAGKRGTMVVILTGYKDFEYAQAALRYGVLDFLLKPCPEVEVCEILRRLHGRLAESKRNKRTEERFLEETTIRALFYRLPYDPQLVERLQPKYAFSSLCLVKVGSYAPPGKSYHPSDRVILQFAIANIIQEIADGFYEFARIVLIRYDRYAVFFGRPLAPYRDLPAAHFYAEIVGKIKELLAIPTECVELGPVERLDRLPELPDGGQVSASDAPADRGEQPGAAALPKDYTLNYAKLQTMESRFMSFIVLGQTELLRRDVAALLADIAGMPLQEARLEALAAAVTMRTIGRKHMDAPEQPLDLERAIGAVHRMERADEIAEWLRDETERFALALARWADSRKPSVIDRALEYIERHYMERCSLQDAAASVYLNPKYFSDLFKRETGQGFVQYVTKVRLEKAAMLLSNTDRKVTEIAPLCGYEDSNYFSTVFRKEYGLSPNEFRKDNRQRRL